MPEPGVSVTAGPDGVAALAWTGPAGTEDLLPAVRQAADAAMAQGSVRRLEAAISAADLVGRRALLRAGFRLEGVRRQAHPLGDGRYADLLLFARLTDDEAYGPHGFSGVMNSALPRKRLIAHVYMTDAEGRVLLCETQFKADWELPGGIVEPDESPRLGAIREVREELGVDVALGPLLIVDWMPPYLGWEDAIECIFAAPVLSEADLAGFVLQPTEIRSVRLCTLDQARPLVTELSHRRLTVAAGLRPGEVAYLENGGRVA